MALFIEMDSGENVNIEFIEVWQKTSPISLHFCLLDVELIKTFKTEKVLNAFIKYLNEYNGIEEDFEAWREAEEEDGNATGFAGAWFDLIPEHFNLN